MVIVGNRQNKIVHPLPSYSDSEKSAKESDDDDETLDSAVSTCVKTDTKFRAIYRKPRGETNSL